MLVDPAQTLLSHLKLIKIQTEGLKVCNGRSQYTRLLLFCLCVWPLPMFVCLCGCNGLLRLFLEKCKNKPRALGSKDPSI